MLVVFLMVAIAIVLAVISEFSSRRQAEDLVSQRGRTVLEGIVQQLEERQRFKEIFAQLLAGESDVVEAVDQGDKVGVSQVVVPLRTRLGLGYVDIHGKDERELFEVDPNEEALQEPLIDTALAGLTESAVKVTDTGLEVSAAAPIKSSRGVVGVMIVGTVLDGDDLRQVTDREDVELAVYHNDRLVSSTTDDQKLVRLLSESGAEPEQLNRDLDRFGFRVTTKPVGDDGQLVALIPTQDLIQATRRRDLIMLASSLVMGGVLLVVGLLAWLFERARRSAELLRIQNLEAHTARLQQSNRELRDFVRVASHDLQEPLRKVRAFADRLKTRYGDSLDERGHDYLERMEGSSARMQSLIEDLLALSRITSQARPFEPVDLTEVANEVISDLETHIELVGGRVEVDELPIIEADRMQMRQLLQNLIGNALKFHKKGEAPVVRVRGGLLEDRDEESKGWRGNGRAYHLIVEDNGIGFEEKYLEQIFAPFERLHGRESYEGTGMGLAICRKVVERHGGEITAHSTPGQGATFVVSLPLRHSENATHGGASRREEK